MAGLSSDLTVTNGVIAGIAASARWQRSPRSGNVVPTITDAAWRAGPPATRCRSRPCSPTPAADTHSATVDGATAPSRTSWSRRAPGTATSSTPTTRTRSGRHEVDVTVHDDDGVATAGPATCWSAARSPGPQGGTSCTVRGRWLDASCAGWVATTHPGPRRERHRLGGDGHDILVGGRGDDVLDGEAGADLPLGGPGPTPAPASLRLGCGPTPASRRRRQSPRGTPNRGPRPPPEPTDELRGTDAPVSNRPAAPTRRPRPCAPGRGRRVGGRGRRQRARCRS